MREIDRQVARRAKAMTRQEVMHKVLAGTLSGRQAARLLGVTERHFRRLRRKAERDGVAALIDGRGGRPRRRRIPQETIDELCRLRREKYRDFSIRHFHEFATEVHGLQISYTKTRMVLQQLHLAHKARSRGKHRRRRERRPMFGMMLHLDGSKHRWIKGLPHHDLIVVLDDATGRMLYAQFVKEEGVLSTLAALHYVVSRYGRFSELYTDRASHFCNTRVATQGPDQIQQGPVPRALKALGIQQIWGYSPQARGRGERAFGTLQGRLPQELRMMGIDHYAEANAYVHEVFMPSYNARFAVDPAQPESAFTSVAGIDLDLLLSIQHERTVRNDNTVLFHKTVLQLPPSEERLHYVRCTVLVHELANGDLGVSYQGQLLGRFTPGGKLHIEERRGKRRRVAKLKTPSPRAIAGPLWQS